MEINIWHVLVATVAMFVFGAIWYMPIFGRVWGKIHGIDFEKMSKKEQAEARKDMGPEMIVQFIITAATAWVLAKLMILLPSYAPSTLAGLVWAGFVVPTQVAAVMFGGTKKEFVVQKSAIMAGGSIVNLMLAAWILEKLMK